MKYTYENKTYEIPDETIDSYMEKLDISLADACEMYLADSGVIDSEEQNELDKKAQKNGRRYEQSATPRKKIAKERKVDQNKAELLKIIANALKNDANIVQIAQNTMLILEIQI